MQIDKTEIKLTFIRAPGPGGQNVNKVATGVLLRFNVKTSTSLPEAVRQRLLTLIGKKLALSGELIIKATRYRTQNRNKQDALERLQALVDRAAKPPKQRKKTKPTRASKEERLQQKKLRSKNKTLRRTNPKDMI